MAHNLKSSTNFSEQDLINYTIGHINVVQLIKIIELGAKCQYTITIN